MANTRPLRYGGVMNSGFPTPPPGVFDDEPPGWTNNAAAPSAASTHAVKPEPYSPPRMATPTAPAMSETLTQRKREKFLNDARTPRNSSESLCSSA